MIQRVVAVRRHAVTVGGRLGWGVGLVWGVKRSTLILNVKFAVLGNQSICVH